MPEGEREDDEPMDNSTLRQRLEADMKTAMRAGDATTRDTVRFILAQVKNAEIDARGELTPAAGEATLRKLGKQLQDSIEQYRKGDREDLAAKEEAQLAVLRRYLPEEMDDAELDALVASVVAEVGATSPKEMGKVIPVVLERAAGRADGRRVSAAVKAALSGS